MVLSNLKPQQAFLYYPTSGKPGDGFSSSIYTIYPTKDPTCGLANGTFNWAMIGIDWNNPGHQQDTQIGERNFSPGATVIFGDNNYGYPLLPGRIIKGKGVKFGIPTTANPSGIQLLPDTRIEEVK
jgi:hypothetical protein